MFEGGYYLFIFVGIFDVCLVIFIIFFGVLWVGLYCEFVNLVFSVLKYYWCYENFGESLEVCGEEGGDVVEFVV